MEKTGSESSTLPRHRGVVVYHGNYTYTGEVWGDWPHGQGNYTYANKDTYTGSSVLGRPDGFGVYRFANGGVYTGFFSYGKFSGIGTYEDEKNIYKGQWRADCKHGVFIRTNKITKRSQRQVWIQGKRQQTVERSYCPPETLITTEKRYKVIKKRASKYKGVAKKCVCCEEEFANATNEACGHVYACYGCLSQCESCGICKTPITSVIQLYNC